MKTEVHCDKCNIKICKERRSLKGWSGLCRSCAAKTHGMTPTRIHRIWRQLRSRCANKNVKEYPMYGGKGIRCCNRWNDFNNFRDDMYESYLSHCKEHGKKDTSLDRINGESNYSPNNCRWATSKEQQNNMRSNIKVTYKGVTRTLRQWADALGYNLHLLQVRHQRGWDVERLLTQPKSKYSLTI